MKRRFHHPALIGLVLTACAGNPKPNVPLGEGPYSFHDTRLQCALLTDDRSALKSDFSMSTEPTVAERIAAAVALPVTAATEIAAWPVSSAFRLFYENEGRERLSFPGESGGTP
jgi:hypothetical protein